jgi:hypothetical protein
VASDIMGERRIGVARENAIDRNPDWLSSSMQ